MHCGHDVLTLQVKAVVAASLTKLLCEPPAAQTLSSDGMAALRRQPPTARQAAAVRDTDQLDGGAITHLFTLIVVPCRAPPQLPYVLKASLSQHSLPPEKRLSFLEEATSCSKASICKKIDSSTV